MKRVLENNMQSFNEFCHENNILPEKALKMPKCYSGNEMYIQTYNESEAVNGLNDNQPADILIIVRKKENSLDFELTEKGREFLHQ